MHRKKISILKNAHFSGKGRQLLHIIRKMLIYCIKLDHALYLINYGSHHVYSVAIILYACIGLFGEYIH